jgi:CBS domain containing-hemolysin-like protein
MHLKKSAVSSVAALVVGVIHFRLLLLFWAYWAAINPLPHVLIKQLEMGKHYRWVLHPSDFLTSVLLCIPLALLLIGLMPRRLYLYTCLAVLPSFAWSALPLVGSSLWSFAPITLFYGLVGELLMVPTAIGIATFWRRKFAPNNSSKPTPLRGAA